MFRVHVLPLVFSVAPAPCAEQYSISHMQPAKASTGSMHMHNEIPIVDELSQDVLHGLQSFDFALCALIKGCKGLASVGCFCRG
jgi:hypothetical protein